MTMQEVSQRRSRVASEIEKSAKVVRNCQDISLRSRRHPCLLDHIVVQLDVHLQARWYPSPRGDSVSNNSGR